VGAASGVGRILRQKGHGTACVFKKSGRKHTNFYINITSVSETIRKPPLVKAQTALRKQKIKCGEKCFHHGGWNFYTLQCGTIMTLISPGDCTLQCGMWLWDHDSEFARWQHPAI